MARPLAPLLAAASAALAIILLAIGLSAQQVEAAASLLLFLALVAASTSLLFMAVQHGQPKRRAPSVVTVISCVGCGYREEREFRLGDFVFKRLDTCAKCGKELFISAIYSVARAGES